MSRRRRAIDRADGPRRPRKRTDAAKAPESAQACGGSESTKDWVRHFYKIGQPHEAIKYCLTEIEQRIDRGKKVPGKKVFKYDLMEGMGAPAPQWARDSAPASDAAAEQAIRTSAAAGTLGADAAQRALAELFDYDLLSAPDDPAGPLGSTSELASALADVAENAPLASQHRVTEFFPGKTAGEKVVTLENLITRMKNWGTNPPVLFEIEAINDNEDLEDRYTTIKILAPTLTEIRAAWPARGLSGLDGFPALARDTAIVFAAAPEPMLFFPPRFFDLYFWSNNQRAWIDMHYLDECLYRLRPDIVLLQTGVMQRPEVSRSRPAATCRREHAFHPRRR